MPRYLSATLAAALLWVSGLFFTAQAQVVLPPNGPPMSIACAYNTVLPTLANLNVGWVQCDNAGHLSIVGTVTEGGSAVDPCSNNVKTSVPIAESAASFQIAAANGTKTTYICSFSIVAASAATINIVEGTGSGVCTGGTPDALLGSTTASAGLSIAANGGLTYGNGLGSVIPGRTAGYNVCLTQSGTTAIAGNVTYVQQ